MRTKDYVAMEQLYQTILEGKETPCPCTVGKKCKKEDCPCPKCKKDKKMMKETHEEESEEVESEEETDSEKTDSEAETK
jgi:hypothetical protein